MKSGDSDMITGSTLTGRCRCGHMLDSDHSCEIRHEEELNMMPLMLPGYDQYGRRRPRLVRLSRFKTFDVRLVCDFCGVRCTQMQECKGLTNTIEEEGGEDPYDPWR